MDLAITNRINYWRSRIRSGPVGEFFGWWWSELRQLLPEPWQEKLRLATRRVTLRSAESNLQLGVQENGSVRQLDEFPFDQDAQLSRQRIQAALENESLQELPRILLLEESLVLRKKVKLPVAAESNLRQVLSFEMDRQTPFRAADVYFDWLSLPASDVGQLSLELVVAPRPRVDKELEHVESRGLRVSGVDVIADGQPLGVNLLPPERRHLVVNPRTRFNLALAAALLLLVVVAMTQSLAMRSERVEKLEAAIAEVQDEARRVQRLREQVQDNGEAASFLTRKRAAMPMAVEVIAEVTRILPDDTYLDRLVLEADGVLMQGKSQNAQQLIELVNRSGMLGEAGFRGSTRLDTASGREIFEVQASLVQPAP